MSNVFEVGCWCWSWDVFEWHLQRYRRDCKDFAEISCLSTWRRYISVNLHPLSKSTPKLKVFKFDFEKNELPNAWALILVGYHAVSLPYEMMGSENCPRRIASPSLLLQQVGRWWNLAMPTVAHGPNGPQMCRFASSTSAVDPEQNPKQTYCGTGKITAIVFWYEMHMDVEGAIDSQVSFLVASRSLQELPFFYGGDVILTNWPESIPHLPYKKVHWVIAWWLWFWFILPKACRLLHDGKGFARSSFVFLILVKVNISWTLFGYLFVGSENSHLFIVFHLAKASNFTFAASCVSFPRPRQVPFLKRRHLSFVGFVGTQHKMILSFKQGNLMYVFSVTACQKNI